MAAGNGIPWYPGINMWGYNVGFDACACDDDGTASAVEVGDVTEVAADVQTDIQVFPLVLCRILFITQGGRPRLLGMVPAERPVILGLLASLAFEAVE